MTWRRALWSMSLVSMGLLGMEAHGSPGWSSRPRWKLPATRTNPCPHGWALGERRIVRRDRARCAQPAQKAINAQRPEPDLSATTPAHQAHPADPVAPMRGSAQPTAWPDATDFATLEASACHDLLHHHDVSFVALPTQEAPEVAQPIRLTGPLADVTFSIPWSKDPAGDPHAIWDCRLAAAMIPLASWLSAQGVREVHYFSVLRRGKMARARPRSHHNVGLAIDVLGVVVEGEPTRWNVEDHYPVGALTECPPPAGLRQTDERAANLWVRLVCRAVAGRALHTILTPDHDHAHRNHLHFDLDSRQTAPADPFVSFATGGRSGK